jgi:hypothetical protein
VTTKLKNLVITKVALCPEGANSVSYIKLYKRKEGGKTTMTFEEILKSMPEDQQKIINAEIEKAKTESATAATTQAKAEAQTQITQLEGEVAKLKKDPNKSEEDILKNVDPAVRALIEKAQNQAAAAQAAVKKMQDEASEAEALAKAKELPNLTVKTEDLAKTLKDLKDANPTLCESVLTILKTANTAAAKVLGETGSTGTANEVEMAKIADAAWTELEKKAEEIKKTKNITTEAAIAQAVKDNPELYKKYLDNLE